MSENKSMRLGELLTSAGVLRQEDLKEAIQIANETGQMIGKVLIMSGYLTKERLQVAIDAQSMVRDGLVEPKLALEAVGMAAKRDYSFETALSKLGWVRKQEIKTAKLGELLLEAGLIAQKDLDRSLSLVQETGQPLGGCLIATKVISPELLLEALNVQAAIREGQVEREAGVRQLSAKASVR